MKILFAASEGVPFCKTGGLADVVGALSGALAAKRHSIRIVLPFYRQIQQQFPKIKPTGKTVDIRLGGRTWPVRILQSDERLGLRVYFADVPFLFDRPGIYGPHPGTVYPDNDARYAFFGRAVFEIAKKMGFKPDVIHGHDWQAGLVMANLKFKYATDRFFAKTASVFTIHNLAYQGNFPAASLALTGLPPAAHTMKGLEFYGNVSFLKAGLVYADAINTVSPTYAKEISTDPAFGCGMEGVLRERSADFTGILNGIDVDFWNPKTDPIISQNFSKETKAQRAANKMALQSTSGLTEDAAVPLLAFIGRLDYQKGIDFLIETMPPLLKEGAQFVSLGQGNAQYTKDLRELERLFPAQVHVRSDFAEPFAHAIYAGADIFLMPSRYEPCGLSQMIAMRYGAPPVVMPTGGLLDTVKDNRDGAEGTGFVASGLTSGAFLSAARAAVEHWKTPAVWSALQDRGMRVDFSWRNPVRDYLLLYESVMK